MRRVLGVLTMLALVAVAAGQDPEPPDPDSDVKKLEGKWEIVKLTSGRGTDAAVAGKGYSMTFAKGKVTVKTNAPMEMVGTFKLDPKKKPPHIDVTYEKDKRTLEGIYELKGEELRITFGPKGSRPKDFASATTGVRTLKREEKKK
jgi:uncharacterized protein (TIGR03067 family)